MPSNPEETTAAISASICFTTPMLNGTERGLSLSLERHFKLLAARTSPEPMLRTGRAARAEYEAKYTAERNYQMLMDVYRKVLGARD